LFSILLTVVKKYAHTYIIKKSFMVNTFVNTLQL
jgi:hypothetical protein